MVEAGTSMVWRRIDEEPSPYLIYFNKANEKFYRWDSANGMSEIETGGGDTGYNVSYSNGVLSFSGSNQPTYNNGILTL